MEKFFKFILYSICIIIGFCMLDCMCSSCLGCDSCVSEFCYEACGIDCSDGCMEGCDGCGDGCDGGCEAGCESCLNSCEDACSPPAEQYEYARDEYGNVFGYMPSWNYCVYEGYEGSSMEITIPSSYNNKPLTKISSYAFSNDRDIAKITLPSSVTTIENYAFQNCSNLREVKMPGVQKIASYAFSNCITMQSVTLPVTLSELNDWVFYDCSSLRTVNYEGTLAQWCKITFYSGTLFDYADELRIEGKIINDLKITSEITSISAHAFHGYPLESITIEEGVNIEEIGIYAFAECSLLKTLTINGSVELIKSHAFASCSSLKDVTLNKNVKRFEQFVFYDTTYINKVIYNGYINDWCAIDFNYNSTTTDCSSNPVSQANFFIIGGEYQSDLIIPAGVEIKPFAFANAKMISSVTTNRNVLIGNYAFYGCPNLLSVSTASVGGGEVTRINTCAFMDCSSLSSVVIGTNVRSIEEKAFANCFELRTINIPKSVITMGSNVFYGCYSLNVYCEYDYIPSGWYYSWAGSASIYWGGMLN